VTKWDRQHIGKLTQLVSPSCFNLPFTSGYVEIAKGSDFALVFLSERDTWGIAEGRRMSMG